MVTYNYNQPYYELHFSDLDKDTVHVLSFEGEEKLSDLFEYRIKLISEDPALDSSKILNKPASFILNRGDEDPIKIHGLISHIEQYGKTTDYVFYQVVLVPRLWSLNLVFQNEIYQKMEIKDVISEVLSDVDLSGGDYKIDLKSSYPKNEYIVQYKETSLNFLNRRLEHYGIYYYFDHSGDKDIVVFTDSNSKLPNIDTSEAIGCNPNKDHLSEKESITELNCCEKVVTGMVQLKDYNYMFPEKQLMAQSQIESTHPGLHYDFGDHFETQKDGDYLAKVRNQELLSRSKIFSGTSDCRLFRVGYKFKIEQHYREEWNSEYILTELSLKGTQQSLFALLPKSSKIDPTFECKFEAIPVDIEYRPPRRTQVPKISGIMSAKLESGSDDEYAFIDDQGRYKAKALFDISDKTNGEASLPIRLSQPHSGAGYGMHFPNRAGTELLWACVDGNVDRPIGLGTVPNPSNSAPVTNNNKSMNIIRTSAGNALEMEDKGGNERIKLSTPYGNTVIQLGSSNEPGEGIVQKTDFDMTIDIGRNREMKIIEDDTINIDGDRDINILGNKKEAIVGNDSLVVKKNISVKAKGKIVTKSMKQIAFSAKKTFGVFAKKDILMKTLKKLKMDAKNDITAKTKKNLKVSTKKNTNFLVDKNFNAVSKNKVTLSAKDNLLIKSNKQIVLKCGGASITLKNDGSIEIKGMKVDIIADTDLKQKGLNVECDATLSNKLTGVNVNVEAAGVNTIKGALVTIN